MLFYLYWTVQLFQNLLHCVGLFTCSAVWKYNRHSTGQASGIACAATTSAPEPFPISWKCPQLCHHGHAGAGHRSELQCCGDTLEQLPTPVSQTQTLGRLPCTGKSSRRKQDSKGLSQKGFVLVQDSSTSKLVTTDCPNGTTHIPSCKLPSLVQAGRVISRWFQTPKWKVRGLSALLLMDSLVLRGSSTHNIHAWAAISPPQFSEGSFMQDTITALVNEEPRLWLHSGLHCWDC